MLKTILISSFLCSASFAATVVPFERDVTRIPVYAYLTSENTDSTDYTNDYMGDENDNLYKQGFTVENSGPNDIVPTFPSSVNYAKRKYGFVTEDGARRDTYLWMTDYNGSGKVSDYFETVMVFLPRQNQMHIEESGDSLLVTLTTGEEVSFDKKSKTLNGGVIKEAALDMNDNRSQRKFAQIKYSGKGIIIRSDANGADPRLAKTLQIIKTGLTPCKIASSTFWTQEDYPKFKFSTDEEAYSVINEKCGASYLP